MNSEKNDKSKLSSELNNIAVGDPSKYTLKLNTDGTYQVKADCNMSSDRYTLEGSRLTFHASLIPQHG